MPTTPKLRFEILKRDGFTCHYCGKHPPDVVLEVDHIIPEKEGGPTVPENLITACYECNRGKGAIPLRNVMPKPPVVDIEAQRERTAQWKAYAEYLQEKQEADDDLFYAISDHWMDLAGEDSDEYQVGTKVAAAIRKYMHVLPLAKMMEAVEITNERIMPYKHTDKLKYFYGVCRRMVDEQKIIELETKLKALEGKTEQDACHITCT